MKHLLLVKGRPSLVYGPITYISAGKWRVESNHIDSVITLTPSSLISNPVNTPSLVLESGDIITLDQQASRVFFKKQGTETEITVALERIDESNSGKSSS